MRSLLFSLVIIPLLFGCGLMLQARVTSFHTLTPDNSGGTFVVVPLDWQKGSLEFQAYEQRVISELKAIGFEPAPVEQAKYAVFLVYSIDSGRDVAFSYPIFGQTGVSSATTSGVVNSYGNMATYSGTTTYRPTYGVVGSGVGTRTEYTRMVRLEILEKEALLNNGQVKKVYEGEVVSVGSTGQLSAVMPALLQALFQNFPSESGQSKTVTMPIR